ncbi:MULTISPECIES: response regulator [Chryseobacterium]|uniref:Response regulator protein vraR n=1 Tax=Chryseobacterium taihuense TaxID=1141221 RepID=A0A4U8WH33_9FLAO|nr:MULTISPECIES: response regulator transcription factor [Chryseobacterium]QQV02375.1 response regulator transcription factor [Chryseobacterium sp. FDAARGOS 1104]VFB04375.1 Response regulator protein vraR [Chryseobacterium taihuense]
MKIKIAFVEDNNLFYQSLKLLLLESEEFDIVGMFSNAESLIRDFPYILPEIVLMDINLPGMSGVEAVSAIKKDYPETKLIILTVLEDDDNVFNSMKAGADGYLLKRDSLEKITEKILLIQEGGAPITSSIAKKIVDYFKTENDRNNTLEINTLTPRELEVLNHISNGLLNKEIADKLFLSIDAIKKIAQSIYEKLQVRNRGEAIKKYLDNKK